MLEVKAVGNTC